MTKIAKRLIKFGMRFMGPHSPQLFEALFIKYNWEQEYDHYFIGTGESKAVAMARAMSHMQGYGIGPIMHEIQELAQFQLPARAKYIEGSGLVQVYCIIGISAEWEDTKWRCPGHRHPPDLRGVGDGPGTGEGHPQRLQPDGETP